MKSLRFTALLLVAGGCASFGGGGGLIPESGDPAAVLTRAEAMIADARQAGADSLANEALVAAGQKFAAARTALDKNDRNRAALLAREAEAEAIFAKATAERTKADRAKTEASAALAALPPGGAQ